MRRTKLSAFGGAVLAALIVSTPAIASTSASVSLEGITNADAHADGTPSAASISGNGSASATARPGSVHVVADDTAHFAVGGPASFANSSFDFTVLGTNDPIALNFTFTPVGQWTFGSGAYAVSGGFSAYLDSATGPSPYITGSFVSVQFGSRIDQGSIQSSPDRFSVAPTVVPYLGEALSPFVLSSSFQGGQLAGGRLSLDAGGTFGNASADFLLGLTSITTNSSLRGISVVSDSGQVFNVTSLASGAPEPGTWALLITGFGAIGAALRRGGGAPVTPRTA